MFPHHPRFRQLALLGHGSSGSVFRVLDEELGLEVALKTLSQAPADELYSLKHEFRIAAEIRHPNLVELLDLFAPADATPFFTMEFVDGASFTDWASRLFAPAPVGQHAGPRAAAEGFLALARQLVRGVQAIHGAGIVHCDIKPSNVLVSPGGRVVLLDFGLARRTRPGQSTAASHTGGTWAYMAPELALGRAASPGTDWYSVALILYECLSGSLPFHGRAFDMLEQKRRWSPSQSRPPLLAVAPETWTTIVATLDPDPRNRPTPTDWAALLQDRCPTDVPNRVSLEASGSSPFVGREAELAKLEAAFWRVLTGHPATVHVVGPAGIGKTRFIERFLEALEPPRPVRILRGRCHPSEAVPFNAFDGVVDELSRLLLHLGPEAQPPLSAEQWGALRTLFPVLQAVEAGNAARGPVLPLPPRELRHRGFAALQAVLSFLGHQSPLIVWIDDLHWADDDSGPLLHNTLCGTNAPPVLLLLSYRDDEDTACRIACTAPEADSTAPAWTERISLGPLSHEQARQLAAELQRNAQPPPAAVDDLVREAAGSPLLLTQLATYPTAQATAPSATGFPRVAAIVLARLQALPRPARLMTEAAAVAGHPVRRRLLLEAGGIGEKGRLALRQATDALLLRVLPGRDDIEVEVFHRRIADALLAAIPARERAAHHAFWFERFASEPKPEPERVLLHALGCGQRHAAAHWAVQAAERADGNLAFSRAAELYHQALTLTAWPVETTVALTVREAEALANAGRGAAAAPLFTEAAAKAPAGQRTSLYRRAAEQYLVTGHIAEGTELLRSLLREAGVPYPRNTVDTLVRVLGRLVQLRWGGIREPRRTPRPVEALRRQVDICDAAAKGLAFVDPLRGLYFTLRRLSAALAQGDADEVALALCTAGAALLPGRGRFQRLGQAMIERGRSVAVASTKPYLRATADQTLAQQRMLECRWQEMRDLCAHAGAVFRQECRGSHWESSIATMGQLRAEEELGNLDALRRSAQAWLEHASALGDRYGCCVAWEYLGWAALLFGDTNAARHAVQRVEMLWQQPGFHMQNFYAARLGAYVDLAEGNEQAAWQAATALWRRARQAGMLRHALLALDADLLLLRARCALGRSGVAVRWWDERLVGVGRQALMRSGRHDARGYTLLAEAGSACLARQIGATTELLRGAAQHFEAAQMRLARALALYELGKRSSGSEGAALIAEARQCFQAQQLANPEWVVRLFAPGLI